LVPLSFQERGNNKKEGAKPPLKTTSPSHLTMDLARMKRMDYREDIDNFAY
jgi:hypothetical protein